MITPVPQHFYNCHYAGQPAIALDGETSGSHLAPCLSCKMNASTAPNQTV